MFKSILAAILIVTGSLAATAQDDRLSSLNFDEEPLPEETTPYAAVGVGPVLNLYMPDVADVNAKAASLGLGNLSSPLLMFGAEIYTAVGIDPTSDLDFHGSQARLALQPMLQWVPILCVEVLITTCRPEQSISTMH